MSRAILLTAAALLAASFAPTASAAIDACRDFGLCADVSCVFGDQGICVHTSVSRSGVCVGVGIGLQGAGACYDTSTRCLRAVIGFNDVATCEIILS